jgi:photosystem II stability/assembly factor-like uncharacterized protein
VFVEHRRRDTGIYASSDGGTTWRPPVVVDTVGAVAVASPMVWWIADPARGTIQITTDAGKTWQTRPSSASGAASSLEALDGNRAWLVVTDAHDISAFYTTGDGGRTWTKVTWKGAA